MKYWTNKNKKALLHSLPFAILLALCFKTYAQAPGSQLDLTNDDMVAQEHYRESLRNCSSQFASAQCQREAHFAFKSTKHSIQIKRQSATAQLKQEKSLKIIALNPASMEDASASSIQANGRKPLLKNASRNLQPSSNSQFSATTPIKPKEPLFKHSTPTRQPQHKQALMAQPSNAQKAINQAKLSAKKIASDARKAKSAGKAKKRNAKDSARKVAGFTVDKP